MTNEKQKLLDFIAQSDDLMTEYILHSSLCYTGFILSDVEKIHASMAGSQIDSNEWIMRGMMLVKHFEIDREKAISNN